MWNEPNLVPHFWTGTKTQYFELYEPTVRAIKEIDPELEVGGPVDERLRARRPLQGRDRGPLREHATAAAADVDALDWRPVWIEDFIDWCAERELPIDFISTHLYPTDFAFGAERRGRAASPGTRTPRSTT